MSNNTTAAVRKIAAGAKQQTSQGLILQAYCNSVLEQPSLDFSGSKTLATYQSDINNCLMTAQTQAKAYGKTQNNIIGTLAQIENYYNLHNAVPAALPPGSTKSEWLQTLNALKDQAAGFKGTSSGIVTDLTTFGDNIAANVGMITGLVTDMNGVVNGDHGVLHSLEGEISGLQHRIDGCIAGCVLSALAIVGGSFMIAVGAIADFVTAGTSTPLIVGGAVVLAAGIGGEASSSALLSTYYGDEQTLYKREANLKAEVKLASGISTSLGNVKTLGVAAVTAATQMENAWASVADDLGELISDVTSGKTDTGVVRKLFLTAGSAEIKMLLSDVQIIKNQMAGVKAQTAPKGQTIGPFAASLAGQYAEAA